jgi:ABC-type antimicrobial peptide transport system permease subunit
MNLSFWGQIGALVGAVLGYINFRVIIAIIEPRLRALDRSPTAEERNAFERKMVLFRRILFVLEIAIMAGVGYFVGIMFGG